MDKPLWSNVRIGQAVRRYIYPIHRQAVERWNAKQRMHEFETLGAARRALRDAMYEMRDEYEAELERLRQQIRDNE